MKHLCLNLKRFDVPRALGGVNRLAENRAWARTIIEGTQDALRAFADQARFPMYFPEAYLLDAARALANDSPVVLGCQGVYREDVAPGGNFGAFTTNRPAAAMQALNVRSTLIGHCEERADLLGVLQEAGVADTAAVSRLLNREIKAAAARGLSVTYCIGEKAEERDRWQDVLREQLEIGLQGVDNADIVIAYEPVWAIGPGKTPPDAAQIRPIAQFIKEISGGLPVIYGGGLKAENAAMIASIPELDGGLIALTRFGADFGFYPDEYIDIVRTYLSACA